MDNVDIVILLVEMPNGTLTTNRTEGSDIVSKKDSGKKVRLENEQESQSENGLDFPKITNELIEALTTRKGRDLVRKILGPPLPGCEERDEEDGT